MMSSKIIEGLVQSWLNILAKKLKKHIQNVLCVSKVLKFAALNLYNSM